MIQHPLKIAQLLAFILPFVLGPIALSAQKHIRPLDLTHRQQPNRINLRHRRAHGHKRASQKCLPHSPSQEQRREHSESRNHSVPPGTYDCSSHMTVTCLNRTVKTTQDTALLCLRLLRGTKLPT
jgi:hypothetical protein